MVNWAGQGVAPWVLTGVGLMMFRDAAAVASMLMSSGDRQLESLFGKLLPGQFVAWAAMDWLVFCLGCVFVSIGAYHNMENDAPYIHEWVRWTYVIGVAVGLSGAHALLATHANVKREHPEAYKVLMILFYSIAMANAVAFSGAYKDRDTYDMAVAAAAIIGVSTSCLWVMDMSRPNNSRSPIWIYATYAFTLGKLLALAFWAAALTTEYLE